jgi:23S rRNA G2069 N7-methylase RlmK/C1962 C5-methylase RlmI
MARLMRWLIIVYQRLPIKPFRRILGKLYKRYRLLNRNKTVVATIDGIKYQLHLGELIDNSMFYDGCFEPTTTRVIKEQVKQGMTVLDIGANVGCHTLQLAKLAGKNGKVIAFEPMSWALSKLKRNIALNNFDNIKIEKLALSDINQGRQSIFSGPVGLWMEVGKTQVKKRI